MKYFQWLFLVFCLTDEAVATDSQDMRSKIGSTFSAPVSYEDKYYFVATTGVLFESNKDFSQVNKLYAGKRQTIGALTLSQDNLIWGDGLHTDRKSTLHIYDLKAKKLIKDLEVEGHIERAPFVHEGLIIIPQGPAGVHAIDAKSFATVWKAKTFEKKNLHVDSNILVVGDKVCATSVYQYKGVVCLNAKSGKIAGTAPLTRDPKSEIVLWNDHVVGFATDGSLSVPKWDIPADLFIYNARNNAMKMVKELRGFNFFAPDVQGDQAFITLSTGDFILFNLQNGKIQFLGEFPEPFTNNAFMKGDEYCGIGIMGKYMCYKKTKSGFALSVDKRIMESVIGEVSIMDGKVIAPSRVGFHIE